MIARVLAVAAPLGFLTIGAVSSGCLQPKPEPLDPGNRNIEAVEDMAAGDGFQVHLPAFEVPGGTEVQDCYFVAVPDINHGKDIFIDRFKLGQRPGSHHLNVFRVNTIVNLSGAPGDIVQGGECRISTNWSDWPLVVNDQVATAGGDPDFDWVLPDGVAQRFHPGELLMVQTHYVNADIQVSPNGGEAKINFYKSRLENPIEMGTLFATQQSIRVCQSQPEVSFDGTCNFPVGADIHIAAANGHAHSRLTSIEMYTWDGTSLDHPLDDAMFYESHSWEEPPMSTNLDAVAPGGGGVWWTCNYEWKEPAAGCDIVNERDHEQADDCCYTFGNSAEVAEHCNVFVYYWPKVESGSIFCN